MISICIIALLMPAFQATITQSQDSLTPHIEILMIIPDMYGANYYLFRDHFENFGWNITLAGLTRSVRACPVYAAPLGCPRITVDSLLNEIEDITRYHAICIVSASKWTSSPPCKDLLESQQTLDLISTASQQGIVIAAWCNAVRVLAAADVINGKNVTGADEFKSEYTASGAIYHQRGVCPIIDGNIVTATAGQSYSLEACESVATAIERCKKQDGTSSDSTVYVREGVLNDHILWSYSIGTHANDAARCIYETADEGYLISGYTYQSGPHDVDIFLVKTDKDGLIQWTNTYGGDGREYGNCCIQTKDHNYLMVGFTTSYSSGFADKDVYILKVGQDGRVLYEKNYGGIDEDEGTSIVETIDGDFLICGYTKSFGAGDNDVFVLKIDADGNELWNHTIGGESSDRGNKIIRTYDGNFVIVGSTGSYGSGLRDYLLIKITTNGDILFRKTYGNQDNYEWALSVCETDDKGFLLVGYCDILFQELLDVYVIKTDYEGNYEWEELYGEGTFYDYGTSVVKHDDTFVIAGVTKSKTYGNDIYLLNIDDNGEKIFSQKIGDHSYDWAHCLIRTKDDTLVLAGSTKSTDEDHFDISLQKISLLDNTAPLTPDKPIGPIKGKTTKSYTYSTMTTDQEGDTIYYLFDWGDGTDSGWMGPYPSAVFCEATYIWDEPGEMSIRVKSKDAHDFQSAWSDPLNVSITKGKQRNQIIERLKEMRDQFLFKRSHILLKEHTGDDTPFFISSFIGGENTEGGWPRTITVIDDEGFLYLAGTTSSNDLPILNGYDISYNGGKDLFICKLSSDLKDIIASTYLGGISDDACYSIVLDAQNNVVIAATTTSSDYPMTVGYDTSHNGGLDIVVTKMSNDLSRLLASTFLGGNNNDMSPSILISKDHDIFIVGKTHSENFPVTSNVFDESFNGPNDVILSRFTNDLSVLYASSFLGIGCGDDYPSISQDSQENIYVSGTTSSSSYPTTPDAFDTMLNGDFGIYISKIDKNLHSLLASTIIEGGFGYNLIQGLDDTIYVTAHAGPHFPMVSSGYDTTFNGGLADAAIARLDSSLSNVISSTFLGGNGNDNSMGICIDDEYIYISGHTDSSDFPTTFNSFDPIFNGKDDAYISKMTNDLSTLISSTYLGGMNVDEGNHITIRNDFLLITGSTSSSDFPTTIQSFDPMYNGNSGSGSYWGGDIFISKILKTLVVAGSPPNIPIIQGKQHGRKNEIQIFSVSSIDPDGDDVFYKIDWGDTITSDWIGPYPSGEQVHIDHIWSKDGTYIIQIKAKDIDDMESERGHFKLNLPKKHTTDLRDIHFFFR